MPLVIEDNWLPATLTAPPMTDEQFAEFCSGHPDLFFEMTAEGDLIIKPPTFTLTGIRNGEISRQLGNWAIEDGRGAASDSSTGFVLPNGARRSPDAAWTDNKPIDALESDSSYWRLCPDFVIELRSESDRLPVLRAKMHEWIDNGAQLAWLIDPERRAIEIFRPGREPEILTGVDSVAGEGPVAGFTLSLGRIWEPRPPRPK